MVAVDPPDAPGRGAGGRRVARPRPRHRRSGQVVAEEARVEPGEIGVGAHLAQVPGDDGPT